MSSNWDDFKFKPVDVPTTTTTPAPTGPSGLDYVKNAWMSEMSRSPLFGFGLGAQNQPRYGQPNTTDNFGHRSNPFQDMMKELNEKMSASRGPLLDQMFERLPSKIKDAMESFGRTYPNQGTGTPTAPAPTAVDVPLTQAERIQQLTSYLTNKKLGT